MRTKKQAPGCKGPAPVYLNIFYEKYLFYFFNTLKVLPPLRTMFKPF